MPTFLPLRSGDLADTLLLEVSVPDKNAIKSPCQISLCEAWHIETLRILEPTYHPLVITILLLQISSGLLLSLSRN